MAALGTDLFGVDDLDPMFSTVSGAEAVAQALARRLITPRGALLDDPGYGYDLRGRLNAAVTSAGRLAIQSAVAAELRKDERVDDVQVTVLFEPATNSLRVDGVVFGAFGPFRLTLSVDAVSVSLLEVVPA